MTNEEMQLIKEAILDCTETYVSAITEKLPFAKTEIGFISGKGTNKGNKVKINVTSESDGIEYDDILSVGNIVFDEGCVVYIFVPNSQYSNMFILGQLADTPVSIPDGSITADKLKSGVIPTNVSELNNDSNFTTIEDVEDNAQIKWENVTDTPDSITNRNLVVNYNAEYNNAEKYNNGFTNTTSDTYSTLNLVISTLLDEVIVETFEIGTITSAQSIKYTFTTSDEEFNQFRLYHQGTISISFIENVICNLKPNTEYTLSANVIGFDPTIIGGIIIDDIKIEEGANKTAYSQSTEDISMNAVKTEDYAKSDDIPTKVEDLTDSDDYVKGEDIYTEGETTIDGGNITNKTIGNNQLESNLVIGSNGYIDFEHNGLKLGDGLLWDNNKLTIRGEANIEYGNIGGFSIGRKYDNIDMSDFINSSNGKIKYKIYNDSGIKITMEISDQSDGKIVLEYNGNLLDSNVWYGAQGGNPSYYLSSKDYLTNLNSLKKSGILPLDDDGNIIFPLEIDIYFVDIYSRKILIGNEIKNLDIVDFQISNLSDYNVDNHNAILYNTSADGSEVLDKTDSAIYLGTNKVYFWYGDSSFSFDKDNGLVLKNTNIDATSGSIGGFDISEEAFSKKGKKYEFSQDPTTSPHARSGIYSYDVSIVPEEVETYQNSSGENVRYTAPQLQIVENSWDSSESEEPSYQHPIATMSDWGVETNRLKTNYVGSNLITEWKIKEPAEQGYDYTTYNLGENSEYGAWEYIYGKNINATKTLKINDTNVQPCLYSVCSTARNVASKVVTINGVSALYTGMKIAVRFSSTVTSNPSSGNITLDVNSLGAKEIVIANTNYNKASYGYGGDFYNNKVCEFMYDGTYWVFTNRDTNTTYSVATTSANGLMSSTDKTKLDNLGSLKSTSFYYGSSATTVTLPLPTSSQGRRIITVFDQKGVITLNVTNSSLVGYSAPSGVTVTFASGKFTFSGLSWYDNVLVLYAF